ncbi:IclR family transcriptional regulator domain-containing protein [Streptomyces sp. NBC_00663]|uniref:IclR family transcriptional regulator domain-containing protein n=1 Tax=Streptomyces sp. NBC_00663 TaxID=2975801 RepID=UPI003FCCBACF
MNAPGSLARRFTGNTSTITRRAALMEELAQVRRTGMALDLEESTPGVCAIAIAVQDTAFMVASKTSSLHSTQRGSRSRRCRPKRRRTPTHTTHLIPHDCEQRLPTQQPQAVTAIRAWGNSRAPAARRRRATAHSTTRARGRPGGPGGSGRWVGRAARRCGPRRWRAGDVRQGAGAQPGRVRGGTRQRPPHPAAWQ